MEKKEPLHDGEYQEPLKAPSGGPPRTIHPQWHDDEEDSNYFMSEPSVSEAESSEYYRPAHIPSLLAPRAESPSSASSKDLYASASPPPPQAAARQQPYPNSPGTSLSSWDSPHLFRKQVQLYFSPDRGSKHLEVPATTTTSRIKTNKRRTSNQSTSSSSANNMRKRQSDDFLRELKQQSVGLVKDARPEDFDSDGSHLQLNGADRDAVIRNVVARNTATNTAVVQTVDTDQDETLVMDLSTDDEEEEDATKMTDEPLDWEAKHSADDEKTAPSSERAPRRQRRGGPGGHRRTRSGDAAAASLMTGGQDWRGMQIDQLPIPSEHDDEEDEHDHSHDDDSEEISTPNNTNSNVSSSSGQDSASPTSNNRMDANGVVDAAGGGFAVGGSGNKNARGFKRPRRNQRVRRPVPRTMERFDTGSTTPDEDQQHQQGMSRDAFSRYALESPRVVPKYVGRASPSNESLSTIDNYMSDSSGHAGADTRCRALSDVDFHIPNRGRRTYSEADVSQPVLLERRVSEIIFDSQGQPSPFTGLYGNNYDPRLSSSDPRYAYMYNQYPFGGAPETLNEQDGYQFGVVEDASPDDTGSEYSRSDDAMEDESDIHSNRLRYDPNMQLDELERRLEDKEMRGRSQHVLRQRLSPFQKFGKMASPRSRRASYMPTSHSVGDYPTFVCPVCKTTQREFFTASSAPSQLQGPTGYLALYFAIYVIAALFIFGLEEGWQALDCVYFAVITLTTAGLGDFVPTSNGAKILCSVFIYFGVACIGLLLGSYLASMLDDKSYKQAQKNRVENCINCARLQNIKTVQMRKQKEKSRHYHKHRQGSVQQQVAAMGFMSERTPSDRSSLGPHVLERDQNKRVRTQRSSDSQSSSSVVPASSEPAARKSSNVETSAAVPSKIQEDSAKEEKEDETKADLEVIDSYRMPLNIGSPEATATRKSSEGTPGNNLGSPLTSQILGRQSHTRHMSLGGHDLKYSSSERSSLRRRKYSEDLSRPQFVEAIPEGAPFEHQSSRSYTQEDTFDDIESDDESLDDSTESEISIESDITLDETARRIKTAKYVLLTLKQALMNSVLIILIGSLGFFTIEGMGAIDSFYFTTVLLTTVGYGDIVPVTSGGKLFATIYVLVAGTVLLHNMSLISFIPLELRKRRIEQAVLTQFGDQLDDAALRELATGPLVQRLQLSTHSATGLEECTREMFALAMMVRLGKVSETDIKQTFKAFRRLDVDNEGILTTKSIIAGMVKSHRSSSTSNLRKAAEEAEPSLPQGSQQQEQPPPPPPPPPFAESPPGQYGFSRYWFSNHGSLHVQTQDNSFRFAGPEMYAPPPPSGDSERSSLLGTNVGYDSFRGQQQQAFGGPDVEQGYRSMYHQVE